MGIEPIQFPTLVLFFSISNWPLLLSIRFTDKACQPVWIARGGAGRDPIFPYLLWCLWHLKSLLTPSVIFDWWLPWHNRTSEKNRWNNPSSWCTKQWSHSAVTKAWVWKEHLHAHTHTTEILTNTDYFIIIQTMIASCPLIINAKSRM